MKDVNLKCNCGKVEGIASGISPSDGTRVVCHCCDCQAFAHYLGKAEQILDQHGGTDIFQITPSQIKITKGVEHLGSMRLTKKGLLRWHTKCCNTPVGNTLSAAMPFVGVIHNFMDDEGKRDDNLGPVRQYVMGKYAINLPAERTIADKFPLSQVLQIMARLLLAKITGKGKPNPFFGNDGRPVSKPVIASQES
ncbi:MAG: hypothetical protein JKY49_13700 [Cohaesibacteraceae bacterium]|nr:hypothetical protein [Cohaesibacteraceae bacterium]